LLVSLQPAQTTASYAVREVRDATRTGWDELLEGAPGGGHVLQGYEWGEFKRRLDWRPIRLVLERDGEVAGIGEFLAYDTGPFVPGALWYCIKGPWLLWDEEGAVRAFFRGVLEVARREGRTRSR
jgi:peptidoglycan pentaglycine glycine transferase (the first glycine)